MGNGKREEVSTRGDDFQSDRVLEKLWSTDFVGFGRIGRAGMPYPGEGQRRTWRETISRFDFEQKDAKAAKKLRVEPLAALASFCSIPTTRIEKLFRPCPHWRGLAQAGSSASKVTSSRDSGWTKLSFQASRLSGGASGETVWVSPNCFPGRYVGSSTIE